MSAFAVSRDNGTVYQVVGGEQNILNVQVAGASTVPIGLSVNPPWHALCSDLIGRDDLANELLSAVTDNLVQSEQHSQLHMLYGTGGSGKTALALSVADRARSNIPHVYWIDGTDEESINSGIIQIAHRLGASPYHVELVRVGQASAVDTLRQVLNERNQPWLIIIDGLDNSALLIKIAEIAHSDRTTNALRGTFIATTRIHDSGPLGDLSTWHWVSPLDPQSGSKLLRKSIGDNGTDLRDAASDGEELSQLLGGLPLALRAAGRYLAFTSSQSALLLDGDEPVTIRQYIDALRYESDLALANEANARSEFVELQQAIRSTWNHSLDCLDASGLADARTLFYVLSMLAQRPIPLALLREIKLSTRSEGARAARAISIRKLRNLLYGLSDFGLVEFTFVQAPSLAEEHGRPVPDAIVVHPVARHALKASGSDYYEIQHVLRIVVIEALAATIRNSANLSQRSYGTSVLLAHHLQELFQWDAIPKDSVDELVQVALEIALHLESVSHHAMAIHLAERACEKSEQYWDRDRERFIESRMTYAYILSHAHRASAARKQYLDLMEVACEIRQPNDRLILQLRHHLATSLVASGQLSEALSEFVELLALLNNELGPRDEQTLLTRGEYASALLQSGRDSEALHEFRVTLETLQSELGRDHRFVIECRRNMVNCLIRLRDWPSAKRELEAIREDFARDSTGDSPLAIHYEIVYHRVSNEIAPDGSHAAEMKDLLSRLSRMVESDDPRLSVAYGELIPVLCSMGALAEAETICRQLADDLHSVHEGSVNRCTARLNLATVLEMRGEYLEARNELAALQGTCERYLGSDHPISRHVSSQLAIYSEATSSFNWQYRCSDPLTLIVGQLCEEIEQRVDQGSLMAQWARRNFLLRLADSDQVIDFVEQSRLMLDRLTRNNLSTVDSDLLKAWSRTTQARDVHGYFDEILARIIRELRTVPAAERLNDRFVVMCTCITGFLNDRGRTEEAISLIQELVPRADESANSSRAVMAARHQLATLLTEVGDSRKAADEYAWVLDQHIESRSAIGRDFFVCEINLLGADSDARMSRRLSELLAARKRAMSTVANLTPNDIPPEIRRTLEDAIRAVREVGPLDAQAEEFDELSTDAIAALTALLMSRVLEHGETDELALRIWEGIADTLVEAGSDSVAEKQYRSLLATTIVCSGPDSPLLPRIRASFASTLARLGRYRDAEDEFRKILTVSNDELYVLGIESGAIQLELAKSIRGQDRNADADMELRVLMDSTESDEIYAEAAFTRAKLLADAGLSEAAVAYRTAVRAAEVAWGINHSNTLVIYANATDDLRNRAGNPVAIHEVLDRQFRKADFSDMEDN
jgi:tetratricopeptide (TPR) repeat protein